MLNNMPYSDILVTLLDILELATRPTFSESDIVCLGVIVKDFLPGNEDFLNSNTKCLLKPISKENLKPWKISASEAAEIQSKLNIPDLHRTPKPRSNWDLSVAHSNISVATGRVFDFIMAQFRFRRQGETPLKGTFGWNEIDYEDFYGDNGGFRFSTSGRYKGVDTPAWRTCLLEEWWDGEVLAGPSLRLVLCTDEFGKKGCLLLSELGAIAQLITFRRTQPEFQTFQLFPVLMISLFGPRHGRIIQACYNRQGDKLQLRISETFCFKTKDDEAFDIFFRFTASYPPEIAIPNFPRMPEDPEVLSTNTPEIQ